MDIANSDGKYIVSCIWVLTVCHWGLLQCVLNIGNERFLEDLFVYAEEHHHLLRVVFLEILLYQLYLMGCEFDSCFRLEIFRIGIVANVDNKINHLLSLFVELTILRRTINEPLERDD